MTPNQNALRRVVTLMRHQSVLLARDPGPLLAYTIMPLLLITVLQHLFEVLGRTSSRPATSGIAQATAGMAVMFSLFALKTVGASLLQERTWQTWDRLRASPARLGEILLGKTLPFFGALVVQQTILFGFAALVLDLRPAGSWWPLVVAVLVWSGCVLLLGSAASIFVRSPAQLSAAGDVAAVLTTILGGALVPTAFLPAWMQPLGPIAPGYWAMHSYLAALTGSTSDLISPLTVLVLLGPITIGVGLFIAHLKSRSTAALRPELRGPQRATPQRSGEVDHLSSG